MVPPGVQIHVLREANLLVESFAAFLAAVSLDANVEFHVLRQAAFPCELLPALVTAESLDPSVARDMLK